MGTAATLGRVVVVIPAHNEAESLPGLLTELHEHGPDLSVVVIDDGSSDATAEVAGRGGAKVVRHPANRGYGAALATGYRHALESGFDTIVRMDADGQHDPSEIAGLLDALSSTNCDLVVGSRMLNPTGHQPSMVRRAGILAFAALGRVLTGERITDPTSGFAAMNRRAAEFLSQRTPTDYPDLNIRIALHLAGLKVIESPTTMRPRKAGQSMFSGVAPFVYVPKMLFYIAREYRRRE